jgi:60 kDa SS-A/Ro ribonucleoprotein
VDGWLKLRNLKTRADGDDETDDHFAPGIIRTHRLQREMVPTELLTKPQVWDAMLPNLGYTALLRNLGNLSKCGLLVAHSEAAKFVREKLANGEAIRKARVHPFAVLLAMGVYSSGASVKGSGVWKPVSTVVDALDGAFELAFGNVEPTGKRYILGLDVSDSMRSPIQGTALSSQQCAAAFAMVTARTEKEYEILGFDNGLRDLKITAKDSMQAVLRKTGINNGGGTDCALPIRFLRQNKIKADAVLVYTDGETWAGPTHAAAELQAYRRNMGVPLKLGMVAFAATDGSIGDPKDPGTMGFCGLDSSLPQAVNAFVNG